MKDKFRSVIAEQLGISVDDISYDSDITEELGADSLDIVELLFALEALTGVSVPDERIIPVGAVVGTHIGPGACAVVYIGK